ncbi:MAG: LamG-like jellyroll fold domain-containing protein [Bacteroidota bacterium]
MPPQAFNSWFENGANVGGTANLSRPFPNPGQYLISLVVTDGGCVDTANTIVVVNPGVGSSTAGANASCNGFADGSADLTPAPGTPNLSIDNNRTAQDWVAANSVANAGFTSGMTMEAWVRPSTSFSSGDGMISTFNVSSGGNRIFLAYHWGLQKFLFLGNSVGNQFQDGATSPAGNWYHVAVTINNTYFARLYVNGVQRKSRQLSINDLPVSGDFYSIGQEWDLPNTSQHFDGLIDEVRVWNVALTGTTIADHYNNDCASVPPTHPNINNLVAYYSMNEGTGNFIFDRSGNDHHGTRTGTAWGAPANNNYGCFYNGTGYAYDWSNGATTEDLTSLAAGTYVCTVTDGAGCQVLDSVTITEPAPVIVQLLFNPTDTICDGDTTGLSASGALNYSWSPGTGLSGTTGSTVNAFPGATTAYQLIGTDATGCADTVDFNLTVNALPVATISGTTTICNGQSTTLTGGGGVSYNWSSGDMTAATTVSPTTNTSYTVTVTDGNGCMDTESSTVTVNALPTIGFSGQDTICDGQSTTLTASGGTMYNWSSGDMTAATTVSPTTTTMYTVTVTDANNCSDTAMTTVTVNALPTISFSGQDTICDGDTTTITAAGGTMYSWNNGDMTAGTTVSPSTTTMYTVVVTDGNSCTDSAMTTVTVNALPTAMITGVDTICDGDAAPLTATGGGAYNWNTGDMTASIAPMPNTTTTYTVTVTDGNNCSDTEDWTVVVNPTDVPNLGADITACDGDSICLMVSGPPGSTYIWSNGATTNTIYVTGNPGDYSVTCTNASGCSGSDTVNVVINQPPTMPAITQVGNTLSTTPGFAAYQWFDNGVPIAGANSDTYVISMDGTYTVEVTDSNGCSALSDPLLALNAAEMLPQLEAAIYPNPNNGLFTVQLNSDQSRNIELVVFDMLGHRVYTQTETIGSGSWKQEIDLQNLSKGMYILQLYSDGAKLNRKIVVE